MSSITAMTTLQLNLEIVGVTKTINEMSEFEGDRQHQNDLEGYCEYASQLKEELDSRINAVTKSQSRTELEIKFLKMLVTRQAHGGEYLTEYDKIAIERFKSAHPQDSEYVCVKDLATHEFLELNPNAKIGE